MHFLKNKAFTRLVKPFARIWTRAKAYWLGCTRNPRYPSFAGAHSYGFTLAEVLITLTILGVVAAITVPSLVKQQYKRTQVSRMAKAYATLEQAATNIAEKTGCIGKDFSCSGLLDITDEYERQRKFVELAGLKGIKNYEKVSGFCSYPLTQDGKYKNNNTCSNKTLIVSDTTAYSVGGKTLLKTSHSTGEYGLIIDVFTDKSKLHIEKGYTSKAVWGRDIFKFVMYGNFQVEPAIIAQGGTYFPLSNYPTNGTSNRIYTHCDPKSTLTGEEYWQGWNCAARIVKDGWKMNY